MSYLTTPTPSIFHSHRRRPSSGGKESSEREYQDNQAYWQNRAAIKAAAEERLRMSLYKSCGKLPSYREEVQSVEGQRVQLRAAARETEAEKDARLHEEQLARLNASPEVDRPWAVATMSMSPEAADSARRRHNAAAARLGWSLFTEGARQREAELEREKAATQSAALQEESFFNMGAASEKWIAPEHRVRHRHVPAVRISSMPWMDAEHAGTPRTAVLQQRERLVSTPAVRRPTAPWLECAGTPRPEELKAARRPRVSAHTEVHSQPLWAWDADPVQKRTR
ncbi:hypothetical protein CVIRNUC_010024 [Coccomyxa viridis]|uniref:Uncharacterized protein n=1 Tax=Coccomyxa viridis TaxID=1274662 RepID=A0AAV1IKQ2_9CHLO|nr:hypothetical protein CVIRNUC_010024 [Coccomyxa viridis]